MRAIARELMRLAGEIAPRLTLEFPRNKRVDDYDFGAIDRELRSFVLTVRGNEGLESFYNRKDTEEGMTIEIGFTDHDAMDAIVTRATTMAKKMAKKLRIRVSIRKPKA